VACRHSTSQNDDKSNQEWDKGARGARLVTISFMILILSIKKNWTNRVSGCLTRSGFHGSMWTLRERDRSHRRIKGFQRHYQEWDKFERQQQIHRRVPGRSSRPQVRRVLEAPPYRFRAFSSDCGKSQELEDRRCVFLFQSRFSISFHFLSFS
jgi:hypothetical protein